MALDFPANPANGQTFGQYIYDTSIPGWRNVNSSEGIGLQFKSGLIPVIPTSVTVANGSASVSSTGIVTVTASSSFTLNGIFSSAYRDYVIKLDTASVSADAYIDYRMASGGTTNSSALYYFGTHNISGGASGFGQGASNATYGRIGYGQSNGTSYRLEVNSPNLVENTVCYSQGLVGATSTIAFTLLNSAVACDGITFIPGGTLSGTFRIYGFN